MGRIERSLLRARRQHAKDSYDLKRHYNAARVHAAQNEAFVALEKRWSHELGGRPIPKRFRKKMLQDPAFLALVEKRLNGEPIVMDDLDHTPTVQADVDGTTRSVMEEELGGDPAKLYCPECGEETETAGARCQKCIDFHANGKV